MRFNETKNTKQSVNSKIEIGHKKRKIQKDRYIPLQISKLDFQIPFKQHNFLKKNTQINQTKSNYQEKLNSTFLARDPTNNRFIRGKFSKILNFSEHYQNNFQYSLFPQIFKTDIDQQTHNKKYFFQKKELFVINSNEQIHDSFYFNILDMNRQNILAYTIEETLYLKKSITNPKISQVKLNLWHTISSIKFSSVQDNIIAVGTKDGDFALCDINNGNLIRTFNNRNSEGRISTIDWAKQNIVANGQKEGKIYLRDVRTKKNYTGKIHTHKYEVCQLKFNPHNSNYLISGGNDDLVCLYDIRKMKEIFKIEDHQAAVKALAWSNHKSNQFISGGGSVDRKVCLWDSHQMKLINKMTKESQICNLDYTCDGLIVASQGFPLNQIEVFDPVTLRTIEIFRGHQKRVLFMTTNNNKDVVITGSPDNTIRYWNVRNLKSDFVGLSNKEELNPNANGFFLR